MQTHLDSLSLDPIPCCLASLLRCPVLTAPVRGSTPTLSAVPPPTASLLSSANRSRPGPPSTACLSRPLSTSGYGEISGPRILCLVSCQNRQMNRLLWQPTHIVLHKFYTKGFCNSIVLVRQYQTVANPVLPILFAMNNKNINSINSLEFDNDFDSSVYKNGKT